MNVLITGTTSGIGMAAAKIFSSRGARVFVVGRNAEKVRELASLLGSAEGKAHGYVLDLRELGSIPALVQSALEFFADRLDLLVNNAGVTMYGQIDQLTQDAAETVFRTNAIAPILLTSALLPALRASGHGHVINVSSITGTQALDNACLYTASKHALEGFSKVLRIEEAPNVRVTVVQPGAVDTGIARYHPRTKSSAMAIGDLTRLTSDEVAEWIWFAANQPRNVRADSVRLTPAGQLL